MDTYSTQPDKIDNSPAPSIYLPISYIDLLSSDLADFHVDEPDTPEDTADNSYKPVEVMVTSFDEILHPTAPDRSSTTQRTAESCSTTEDEKPDKHTLRRRRTSAVPYNLPLSRHRRRRMRGAGAYPGTLLQ